MHFFTNYDSVNYSDRIIFIISIAPPLNSLASARKRQFLKL